MTGPNTPAMSKHDSVYEDDDAAAFCERIDRIIARERDVLDQLAE